VRDGEVIRLIYDYRAPLVVEELVRERGRISGVGGDRDVGVAVDVDGVAELVYLALEVGVDDLRLPVDERRAELFNDTSGPNFRYELGNSHAWAFRLRVMRLPTL